MDSFGVKTHGDETRERRVKFSKISAGDLVEFSGEKRQVKHKELLEDVDRGMEFLALWLQGVQGFVLIQDVKLLERIPV